MCCASQPVGQDQLGSSPSNRGKRKSVKKDANIMSATQPTDRIQTEKLEEDYRSDDGDTAMKASTIETQQDPFNNANSNTFISNTEQTSHGSRIGSVGDFTSRLTTNRATTTVPKQIEDGTRRGPVSVVFQ